MKRVAQGKPSARARHERPAAGRVEETILLVLVLIEPLLFTPWTRNPFAAKDLFFAVGLLALAGARLTALRARRAPGPLPLLPAAALALVVILNLALAAFSAAPGAAIAHACRLLGYGALFLLVASRAWDALFFRRFAATILAGTITASLYGMLQAAHLDPVRWVDTFRIAGAPLASLRIFSTFGHPNFFGPHLAMALFFMGALFLIAERPLTRAATAVGIAMAVVCLLLTANRGSWVGFLAGALSAVILLRGGNRRGNSDGELGAAVRRAPSRGTLILVGMVLVAAVVAVGSSEAVRSRLAVRKVFDDPTVRSRALIWSGAMRMFQDRPLSGHGPGTFGSVFPFYRDERLSLYHDELTPVTHAHNEYLEMLAETGILGFLPAAFFAAVVFRRGYRKVMKAGSREVRLVHTSLFAAAVSILVSSFFGVELRYANSSIFLWLLLGMMATETPVESGRPAQPGGSPPRGWISIATATAAGAGAAACLVVSLRAFTGEVFLRRAERNLAQGAAQMAAAAGRSAFAWDPAEPAGLMLAGEALVKLKDYRGARDIYREVEKLDPGEPLIGYNLALTEFFLGNYDESMKALESARKLYPRHAPTQALLYDIWLKKGLALVQRADYQGAAAAFLATGELDVPGDPRAVFLLGNVQALEKNYALAIDCYRKALAIDPAFKPAAENLRKIEQLTDR